MPREPPGRPRPLAAHSIGFGFALQRPVAPSAAKVNHAIRACRGVHFLPHYGWRRFLVASLARDELIVPKARQPQRSSDESEQQAGKQADVLRAPPHQSPDIVLANSSCLARARSSASSKDWT